MSNQIGKNQLFNEYIEKFEDSSPYKIIESSDNDYFDNTIEFKVPPGGNSGIYLRGVYEAQVLDRDSRMQGIQGVGAIFGRILPLVPASERILALQRVCKSLRSFPLLAAPRFFSRMWQGMTVIVCVHRAHIYRKINPVHLLCWASTLTKKPASSLKI